MIAGTASGSYALKVMTIGAAIFFPLVLLYQGWSFHVFRARVTTPPAQTDPPTLSTPLPVSPELGDDRGGVAT